MDTSPDTNLSYIYFNGLGKPILYNVTNNDPVIPHGISVPLISVISIMIIGGKQKDKCILKWSHRVSFP